VLRYPNVYGPRQNPRGEAGVVAIFTGRMLKAKPVTIFGTGEQVRDFVYVGDCARANILLLDQGSRNVYNLGCGTGTSINQIFETLKIITDYPYEPVYAPGKPGETFKIYLSAKKAARELGWQPTIGLREGLEQTVEYIRENETG
jgi:UDP-glucose 4-epimerase